MNLEVQLSVMNLKKEDLDKMNITSKCTVINQCGKEGYEEYKNFKIYSYNEKGLANSRNRGLEHATEDIILLCDDDVIYDEAYEESVIKEFENNPKADMIVFNFNNPYRKKKAIKKRKRLHIYNCLRYASYNIAFKRESAKNIRFNTKFGPKGTYDAGGDDTIFMVDFLKNGLKIYSSSKNLGKIESNDSTWFNGYDEKYFFARGALFTEISVPFRKILILQHILRHKEFLDKVSFRRALKVMLEGSKDYINRFKK